MKNIFTLLFLIVCGTAFSQGKQDIMKIKCNFNPVKISPTILAFCDEASPIYRNLITRMFAYCGQRNLLIFIGNTISAELDYACCGYNQKNQPSIIINEQRLNALPTTAVISILAHEIGHFNNRNIDAEGEITRQMELDADFHNGFWNSRNGIDSLGGIFFPYSLIDSDSIHPSYHRRTEEVRKGFVFGKEKFAQELLIDSNASQADSFKNSIDFIITVNPKFELEHGDKKYDVFLNVAYTGAKAKDSSKIFDKITFVRYVLDTTFKRQLVKNRIKVDNFEFRLTKVWGDFPVTAIIRFEDYTEVSITKNVNLPD